MEPAGTRSRPLLWAAVSEDMFRLLAAIPALDEQRLWRAGVLFLSYRKYQMTPKILWALCDCEELRERHRYGDRQVPAGKSHAEIWQGA